MGRPLNSFGAAHVDTNPEAASAYVSMLKMGRGARAHANATVL